MTGCKRTCASDNLDCYVLDNSGFVIISEEMEHTGKFFGQIDGTIMDSLVQDRIYKRVTVNDYQGVCSDADNPYTAAGGIMKPNRIASWFFNHLVALSAAWLALMPSALRAWPQDDYTYDNEDVIFMENNYSDEYEPEENDYNLPVDQEMDEFFTTADVVSESYGTYVCIGFWVFCCINQEYTTPPPRQHKPHIGPRFAPDPQNARRCDLRTDLYMLQPERLIQGGQNNPLKVGGLGSIKYSIYWNGFCRENSPIAMCLAANGHSVSRRSRTAISSCWWWILCVHVGPSNWTSSRWRSLES